MEPTEQEPTQPTQPSQETQTAPPSGGAPGVRLVLVRAVALGLIIVIAITGLVWLVSIPLLSLSQGSAIAALTPPATPTEFPGTTPQASSTGAATLTVEQLPKNSEVYVRVQPKDMAGHVTVQFGGGPGKAMVKEISIRLTRPDGSVETGSMGTQTEFPEVTLLGSKGTDRVEVFARFLSGKTYRITDEPVFYRSGI
jgi:hypothetical protein